MATRNITQGPGRVGFTQSHALAQLLILPHPVPPPQLQAQTDWPLAQSHLWVWGLLLGGLELRGWEGNHSPCGMAREPGPT